MTGLEMILWALTTNTNLLVFWLLIHIPRTSEEVECICADTKPFIP